MMGSIQKFNEKVRNEHEAEVKQVRQQVQEESIRL